MPAKFLAVLLALGMISIAADATTAQDHCDRISLVVDEDIYGSPTAAITQALPELQRRFDESLLDICETANDPLDWLPSAELVLLNAPEANQMSIYLSEDDQGAAIEYPFETVDGVLSDLPATEEFRRAIICASEIDALFQLDPTDCLPD